MGRTLAWPVAIVFSLLAPAVVTASAGDDEPYWNSKPLSYWIARLGSADPGGRAQAAQSVAEIAIAHGGSAAAPAVAELMPNLRDPQSSVRESAAHALEQIGSPAAKPAVPALLDLLRSDDVPDVRRRAALALGRIDPASAQVVSDAARTLRDERDSGVRVSAAVLLVSSGAAAGAVAPTLESALADDDHGVRLYAAAALAQSGQLTTALPVLLGGLEEEDAALRSEAAGLLAGVAPGQEAVVPALVRTLRDHSPDVRGAAVEALGRVGKPAQEALPAIWALMRDPDETVRARVLAAVKHIKSVSK
jgi:HEAT repeat protein